MNPSTRTLSVGTLTRVEGEGALHVKLKGGALESVQLNIYEPPRFFEAFLRGRAHTEPPDMTARVCGICPVAYQVSACNANMAGLRSGICATRGPKRIRVVAMATAESWVHISNHGPRAPLYSAK